MESNDIRNKKVSSEEATKNETELDSKTLVNLRLHGERDVISIRCKPEVKEAFTRFCEANGLSTCHIFEALTTAFLVGMKQKIDWVNQSPTINLTLVREVKRLRRVGREYDVEGNFYDPKLCIWDYVPDAVLNENGHAIGCGCKICRGKRDE